MNPTEIQALIQAAEKARQHSYSPYSQYAVGCALMLENGEIISGCNIENVSFPAGICAEQVALAKALSEGKKLFKAMAVVTENGGTSCGICRQMLAEHAPDMPVISSDLSGHYHIHSVSELLPFRFEFGVSK